MKIVTIIGARPQFVKASIVSLKLKRFPSVNEILIHTGQHYDVNMSGLFFQQLKIPPPHYNLNINNLNHGAMTGRMLESIEEVLIREKPDYCMVYGDTNSTLAGALAAKKLHIRVTHVEAGLRSFNMQMPEEINRILTDRISDILFCPTKKSMDNLHTEGFNNFNNKIFLSGDVMEDA
jgi:UDP-GlcNAc3NAcA epimerase